MRSSVFFIDPAVDPESTPQESEAAPERAKSVLPTPVAMAIVIAAISILPGLWQATLWEPDEPRFAEATRQMFDRGDFLTPYLNGVPRFEKPPLMYWLQSLAFLPLGANEFSARLPSAIAGVGCVWLLYLLTESLVSRRAALIAAVALATMFRFVVFARQGLTDVPTLFFILAALLGFIRTTDARSRPHILWLAWLAVGLGALTKGPVGLLPLSIWAGWAIACRDWRVVTRIRPLPGLALVATVAAPWYVAMFVIHGRSFTDFAIGHEIVSRVWSETSFAPVRGLLYYWQIWPGDAAPWSLLFVTAAVWSGVRRQTLAPGVRRAIRFALVWFVAVFVVFMLSQSKIPHYILPAYPAAALLIGIFIDRMSDRPEDAVWWRLPMSLVAITCVAAAMVLLRSLPVLMSDVAPAILLAVPLVLAGGGVAVSVAVWRSQAMAATWSLAIALSLVFALIGSVVVPVAIEPFKPMPRLAAAAARLTGPGEPIGLLGMYGVSSVIYYSRRNVQWLLDDDAVVAFVESRPRVVCVMPAADFDRLAPRLPSTMRVVESGEEFNVRLSRVLERQTTPGRKWVVIARP